MSNLVLSSRLCLNRLFKNMHRTSIEASKSVRVVKILPRSTAYSWNSRRNFPCYCRRVMKLFGKAHSWLVRTTPYYIHANGLSWLQQRCFIGRVIVGARVNSQWGNLDPMNYPSISLYNRGSAAHHRCYFTLLMSIGIESDRFACFPFLNPNTDLGC